MRSNEQVHKAARIRDVLTKNPFLSDHKIAARFKVSPHMVWRVRNAELQAENMQQDPDFFTPEELKRLDDWLSARGLMEPIGPPLLY